MTPCPFLYLSVVKTTLRPRAVGTRAALIVPVMFYLLFLSNPQFFS